MSGAGKFSSWEEGFTAHPYRSQSLDRLGLVAGMFDAPDIGEIID